MEREGQPSQHSTAQDHETLNDEAAEEGEDELELQEDEIEMKISLDADASATDEPADDENVEVEEFDDDSVQAFSGHHDSVYSVSFHPLNHDLVVSGGGDDKAFIWSVKTGQALFELTGHTDSVSRAAFNFDGKLVATASLDGTVRIWNVDDGKLVRTLEGPSAGIEWLDWHPKGNIVLAGSEDGTAWMWLTATGACLQVFSGHASGQVCTCGGFTPDGKRAVTASADGSLRVWNPKTAACELTLAGRLFHEAGVSTLAMHHEQPLLLTGSVDHSARLVNLSSGKILGTLGGHTGSVETVGFSRAPLSWAATGSVDNIVRVWDLNTLQPRLSCAHDDGVTQLHWHPVSPPLLYSASVDRTVRLWDTRTGQATMTFRGHANTILAFDVSADGNTVVTGSDDHYCLLFTALPDTAASVSSIAAPPPSLPSASSSSSSASSSSKT